MATGFIRPTLAQLVDRVSTDLETGVTGVTARLRRTFEYALARAIAGVSHSLHGHLAWLLEQYFPDSQERAALLRFGKTFGVIIKPPTKSSGPIAVVCTGGTMPIGTIWYRPADSATFKATTAVTAFTGTAFPTVEAVTAGAAGNYAYNQTLKLATPITNIGSTAYVYTGGLIGGADEEDLELYRERVLDRLTHPPMGGAPGDHVAWAKEVPGVTRAWEYSTDSLGTPTLGKIALTFMMGDAVPTGGEVAVVQAYLAARSAAEVTVFAPTPVAFDVAATLTPYGDSLVQDAVELELEDMIRRDGKPGGTIYVSKISAAIDAAAGETSHVLNSPTASITYAFGEIPVYGWAPDWS